MNRHQRRKAVKQGRSVRVDDVISEEAARFSAELQTAAHAIIERSASYMPAEDERAKGGRIVQGLGLTAAAFAMGLGASEEEFGQVMRLYFRQAHAELKAALATAKADKPSSIIKPPN